MKRLLLISALALASCATTPKTPAQSIYAMKVALAASLATANAYAALPVCPTTMVCSDPATVTRIYEASTFAAHDLNVAEAAVTSGQSAAVVASELAAAQNDLDALTALTSQVKLK